LSAVCYKSTVVQQSDLHTEMYTVGDSVHFHLAKL